MKKQNDYTKLSELDITNKTNGYAMIYDSATSKVKLQPLPIGTITGAISYTIELSRWGITQGLPSKRIESIGGVNVNCYSNADYAIAYNNIIGFNNAFAWAKANGYDHVIVPFGTYSLCYSNISDNDKENRIVIDYDYFSVDLNTAIFKVMFDSSKRSPYDKMKSGSTYVTSTEPTYFCGNGLGVMIVRDCNYTELKNGKVIGDKIDRDWIDVNEKGANGTYGILAGGNCKYINIEGHDVSLFMGDGITMSSGKNNVFIKNGYDLSWALGDLDPTTGALIASTTRCVCGFVPINSSTPHFWQGAGTTQGLSSLGNKRYTVYMYDINKVFIKKETVLVLRDFVTTKFTKFVRFVVEESVVDPNGWTMKLQTGYYGSYITFQNNYIHHNHRGGSSPGVNDMLITNNHYYNNGEWYDYENDLIGFQTSATRYHINMEDAQGYNMRIIGNKFEGGRLGIAARGYDYVIKDNYFRNCGVTLYRMIYCVLKDNYFEGIGGFSTHEYNTPWNSYQDFIRYWDIEGNVIEGDFTIYGDAVIKNISNNTIQGQVFLQCDVNNFRNNRFKIDKDIGFSQALDLKNVSKVYGCQFLKSDQAKGKNSMSLENMTLYDCTFKNMKVQTSNNVVIKDSVITDTGFNMNGGSLKFEDCQVNQGTYVLNSPYSIGSENSAFVNVTTNTLATSLEFKDCDIVSTSTVSIFSTDKPKPVTTSNVKITRTKIDRQVNNKLGLDVFGGVISVSDTQITAAVAVPSITPNAALTHRFVDNTLTNVSFTMKVSDIIYTQQDVNLLARPLSGSGVPSVVPQKLGQEYYDTTGKKLYKAFGTVATTDWVIMN